MSATWVVISLIVSQLFQQCYTYLINNILFFSWFSAALGSYTVIIKNFLKNHILSCSCDTTRSHCHSPSGTPFDKSLVFTSLLSQPETFYILFLHYFVTSNKIISQSPVLKLLFSNILNLAQGSVNLKPSLSSLWISLKSDTDNRYSIIL